MSFRIELDKYERAYGRFLRDIQRAIQKTFAEEEEAHGLNQAALARELKTDPSVVSRRLNGSGNVTLRTICDLYTAMGREPLSNFEVPEGLAAPVLNADQLGSTLSKVVSVQIDRHTTAYANTEHLNLVYPTANMLRDQRRELVYDDALVNNEVQTSFVKIGKRLEQHDVA